MATLATMCISDYMFLPSGKSRESESLCCIAVLSHMCISHGGVCGASGGVGGGFVTCVINGGGINKSFRLLRLLRPGVLVRLQIGVDVRSPTGMVCECAASFQEL